MSTARTAINTEAGWGARVRLKMAPNSLFAILLRSSWWISLSLALALVAAARALMPAEYWAFGAMGALPLVAIAVIALVKQLRRPGRRRVQAVQQAVRSMTWRDFSQALEDGFRRDGYGVERIDGAADFAVTRAGHTELIAARRWKAARHGEEALAALHAQMRERAASECTYIAIGEVSDNARRFARDHGVNVMREDGLVQLLRAMPMPKV